MKNAIIIIAIAALFLGVTLYKNKSNDELNSELHVDETFKKEEFLRKGIPTLFDIGGHTCVLCKEMEVALEELNSDLTDKAFVKFVDITKYPILRKQFDFKVIPTQFYYDSEGELFKVTYGAQTKEKMIEVFAEMGYTFD